MRDTFAVKYRARRCQGGGVDAAFDSLFVLRRYETSARECWIRRGVSASEQYTTDVLVDETGSLEMSALVVEAPASHVAYSIAGTMIKSSVQYETKQLGNRADTRHRGSRLDASAVTALVPSSYEDDLVEVGEMMETMVLKESLRMRATPVAHGSDYSVCL